MTILLDEEFETSRAEFEKVQKQLGWNPNDFCEKKLEVLLKL